MRGDVITLGILAPSIRFYCNKRNVSCTKTPVRVKEGGGVVYRGNGCPLACKVGLTKEKAAFWKKHIIKVHDLKIDDEFVRVALADALKSIAEKMLNEFVSVAIVVEEEKPLGVITPYEILKAISSEKPWSTKAEEIINKDIYTVNGSMPLIDLLSDLLEKFPIPAGIIVVDDEGKLKGMLSKDDMIQANVLTRLEAI